MPCRGVPCEAIHRSGIFKALILVYAVMFFFFFKMGGAPNSFSDSLRIQPWIVEERGVTV